ncbi:hypothetical protein ACLKA7_001688 [Drosophila subpalustris]
MAEVIGGRQAERGPRMQKQADPATEQLHTALKAVLTDKAAIKAVHDTVTIEVLNIDETTSADEVLSALFASFEGDIPVEVVPAMRKAYGGKQIATLAVQPSLATNLLNLRKAGSLVEQRHRQSTRLSQRHRSSADFKSLTLIYREKRRSLKNRVRVITNAEEVLALSAGIKIAKASGPDEIPNVAIKHIIAAHPDLFADFYNAFWRERCQGDGRSNV